MTHFFGFLRIFFSWIQTKTFFTSFCDNLTDFFNVFIFFALKISRKDRPSKCCLQKLQKCRENAGYCFSSKSYKINPSKLYHKKKQKKIFRQNFTKNRKNSDIFTISSQTIFRQIEIVLKIRHNYTSKNPQKIRKSWHFHDFFTINFSFD